MSSAYILAERRIIEDAEKGIDTTGHLAQAKSIGFEPMGPEEFFSHEVDGFGNIKNHDPRESLLAKAREVRKLLDKAIENDEYEKAQVYQYTLDALQRKYDKL